MDNETLAVACAAISVAGALLSGLHALTALLRRRHEKERLRAISSRPFFAIEMDFHEPRYAKRLVATLAAEESMSVHELRDAVGADTPMARGFFAEALQRLRESGLVESDLDRNTTIRATDDARWMLSEIERQERNEEART